MKWLEKYNNGGWLDNVVKDNEGYWNPDNHGKVVEIDSNNITMKGVNQELLGVSDTGDTKVMKPGEDYKFKGTKVREYPMAQDGILEGIKDGLQRWNIFGEEEKDGRHIQGSKQLREYIYETTKPMLYSIGGAGVTALNMLTGNKRGTTAGIKKSFIALDEAQAELDSWREEKYKALKKGIDFNKAEIDKYDEGYKKIKTKKGKKAFGKEWLKNFKEQDSIAFAEIREKFTKKLENSKSKVDSITNVLDETTGGYSRSDEDMWRFYLGHDQIDDSVRKSQYRPTNSKDPNAEYYTIKDQEWKENLARNQKDYEGDYPRVMHAGHTGIANATIDMGEDERGKYMSIYDKYDFALSGSDKIGAPYEIYDRVYLDDLPENKRKKKEKRPKYSLGGTIRENTGWLDKY